LQQMHWVLIPFLSIQKLVELVEPTIDPPELMLMLLDELKVEPVRLPWPSWIGARASLEDKGLVAPTATAEFCGSLS